VLNKKLKISLNDLYTLIAPWKVYAARAAGEDPHPPARLLYRAVNYYIVMHRVVITSSSSRAAELQ
jgi:hypothetical protein